MFNPIKMNLYLSENCPIDTRQTFSANVGGDPKDMIADINNDINRYLEGVYIGKFNKRNHIYFKFDELVNKQTDIFGSTYLGKGGITSVFGIKYLQSETDDSNLIILRDKNLIIRIVDLVQINSIDTMIQKYVQNKLLFGENIIDIYLYGGLYTPDKGLIGYYTITRYYDDFDKILKLNWDCTNKYFLSFINFLVKLEKNKYYYRDLKSTNIGLDINRSNQTYTFIVLDYDDITIINKTDNFFSGFKVSGCFGKYCAGTMIPYFIIKDYLTLNPNWLDKFDKVHVLGLAEIMIKLFFQSNKHSDQVLKMIYEPSRYDTCIHCYQLMELYDNEEKYEFVEYSLINMIPRFSEINGIKKDDLIYLVINLMSKDYKKINSAEIIYDEFKTQIVDLPTHITLDTGKTIPVDSIKFIPVPYSSNSIGSNSSQFPVSGFDIVGGNKKLNNKNRKN